MYQLNECVHPKGINLISAVRSSSVIQSETKDLGPASEILR